MNKQELLEELESNKDKCLKEAKKYEVLSWDRQIVDSKALVYMQVINWVEQLAEQPKVTVPQFLAKFIQDNKGNSASDIFSQDWFHESVDETDDEVNKWLYDNDTAENDRRYLIAVQAFVTGEYEVEKEPVYEVVFLESDDERYLLMELGEKSYEVVPESENDGYRTQWFTESEIKSIDERYWAFAVPVEEVK